MTSRRRQSSSDQPSDRSRRAGNLPKPDLDVRSSDMSSTDSYLNELGTAHTSTSVSNYSELDRALQDQISEITLTDNVICPENLLVNYDLTINFNGHSLISDESTFGARLLDIRRGNVHLAGQGKVFAMGQRSVAIRIFGAISAGIPSYTTLTVDPGITLFAPDSYGILISPNLGVAYGLTIDFSGRILSRHGICLPDSVHGRDLNPPVIHLHDGAVITADELNGTALTASGFGYWHIDHAELRGYTGALLAHGTLDFHDTHIITSAPDQSFAFQLEPISDPADLAVTIDGGAYISERAPVISGEPQTIKSFQIQSGEFRSPRRRPAAALMKKLTVDQAKVNFASDVQTFLAQLPAITPLVTEVEPLSEFATAPDPLPVVPAPLPSDDSSLSAAMPAPKPTDSSSTASPETNAPLDDLTAARVALSDALAEIRQLNPDDYEVGFTTLQDAIHQADLVLSNASSSLIDIRDTASQLLSAFDQLEERTELSLTDSELDELFYQGSVLRELSAETPDQKSLKPQKSTKAPKPSKLQKSKKVKKSRPVKVASESILDQLSDQGDFIASNPSVLDSFAPEPEDLTHALLDFSQISYIFQKVSELDLGRYTVASQTPLLRELDRIQPIIADPETTQATLDTITDQLSTYLSNLRPVRNTNHILYSNQSLSSPAPLLGSLIPAAMFDALEPEPIWSLGVTMIDEQTPFITDETTRRRLQRSTRSRFIVLVGHLTDPLRAFAKNFTTACRAGLDVYRVNRRAAKRY